SWFQLAKIRLTVFNSVRLGPRFAAHAHCALAVAPPNASRCLVAPHAPPLLGRNFPYLPIGAARGVGSDLPGMIARVRELVPRGAVVLSSEWYAVRAMPFDLIFASLV